MRVIKEGRKPLKEVEQKCARCGCEFAYERDDVENVEQYNESHYYVICPTCKNHIYVDPFPKY